MAYAIGYPDIFERYTKDAITTFNQLGIKQIITSCPTCIKHLNDARSEEQKPVAAHDIVTLIHQSLK